MMRGVFGTVGWCWKQASQGDGDDDCDDGDDGDDNGDGDGDDRSVGTVGWGWKAAASSVATSLGNTNITHNPPPQPLLLHS